MTAFDGLVDAFLEHFWDLHPVDASFAGVPGHDHRLPPAERETPDRERRELSELARRLGAAEIPDDPAARIDARLMHGYLAATLAQADARPRFANPAWYTGEIAFGIIALLLPGAVERDARDLAARVAAIPDQLEAAAYQLADRALPADFSVRAQREAEAVARLLQQGLGLHPLGASIEPADIAAAVDALERFVRFLAGAPAGGDPAAGAPLFALLAREVHAFEQTPAEIERDAAREFARISDELAAAAARLDPQVSWRAAVDALAQPDLAGEAVIDGLTHWNARAIDAAAGLVTPAAEYGLTFAPLPAWAAAVADDLYFLFYRSPPAFAPGSGSLYWATSPQSTAMVKLVHAVHHGSIGHHTQNARARAARSRLARMAGSDGASGIALLGGGSLAEGWACYAEDLLAEVDGFYTPHERLLLLAFELRNVATCLGDIRLHTGMWTIAEMRRFYAEDAAFSPARIWSETTRNAIFPASRVMYWMGTRGIRALRAQSPLAARAFHDRLLSFGAAPVAVIAAELQGAATLR